MSSIHSYNHSHDSYSHRNNSYSHHNNTNIDHVDGYNPKRFSLPSENVTPHPLPHVDHVDIGVHRGWDPSLVRPTFAK